MGNYISLLWTYSRWWHAPSTIAALTIIQRLNRHNSLGIVIGLIYRLWRLSVTRFWHWLWSRSTTTATYPFTYRQQVVIDVSRATLNLNYKRMQQAMKLSAALECFLFKFMYRQMCSPVISTSNAHLLGKSTWFGAADLVADSTHVLVYAHGGGYCSGNSRQWPLFFQYVIDQALASGYSLRILSVEYPLAQDETTLPTTEKSSNGYGCNGFQRAISTFLAAYDYLVDEVGLPPNHLVFGGDSAGAHLALTSCLALRDNLGRDQRSSPHHHHNQHHQSQLPSSAFHPHPSRSPDASSMDPHAFLPAALILISPWMNMTETSGVLMNEAKAVENAQYDFLARKDVVNFRRNFLNNSENYAQKRKAEGLPFEYEDDLDYGVGGGGASSGNSSATASPLLNSRTISGELAVIPSAIPSEIPVVALPSASSSSTTASTPAFEKPLVSASHPLLSPLYADLSSLPPVHLVYGGREILVSDILEFRAALESHEVHVDAHCHPEMIHDYPIAPEGFGDISREAIRDMVAFMVRIFSHQTRRLSHFSKELYMKRNLFSTTHLDGH